MKAKAALARLEAVRLCGFAAGPAEPVQAGFGPRI